jgi:hypothetical protein
MIPLLTRIVHLQEEQNALLRELHLALTGHQALSPRRTLQRPPTRPLVASAVWQRTPLTEHEQQARDIARRESAATHPIDPPIADGSIK